MKEAGRDKAQGNAILYATTRTFLEKFGLKDTSELPPLEEFAPDAETARAIGDRLSGTSPAPEHDDASDVATDDVEFID